MSVDINYRVACSPVLIQVDEVTGPTRSIGETFISNNFSVANSIKYGVGCFAFHTEEAKAQNSSKVIQMSNFFIYDAHFSIDAESNLITIL